MEILDNLSREHAMIRQFLENLQMALDRLEEGARPPEDFFHRAVEFARSFTDQYHHFKEEYILFNHLAMKKKGEIDGQVDSLKYQHERGRALIRELAKALDGYGKGQEAQRITVLENLAACISLLRQHIHKEDHLFFPMVEKEIPAEEHQELLEIFRREEKKLGEEFLEKSQRSLYEMGRLLLT